MSLILSTMILLKSVNSWEFNSEILCDGNLTRFTANSKQEVIHFLFAASSHVRPPSLLVLYSPLLTSEVTVQCENFVSRNFTLSKGSVKATSVTSAYGVLFYQFRYYRDVYDKATVPVVDENPFYFASNLDWQLESCDDEPDAFSVSFAGKKKNDPRDKFLRKGKIKLKFTVYKKDAKVPNGYYYTVQPNREVQVQVIMDKLNLKSKEARVAPVIFLYSNKPLEKNDDFLTKSAYALNAFTGPLGNMMSIYVILNGQTKHVKEQEIQSIPGFIHFPPIACSQVECADQSAVLARLGDRVQINRTAVKKYKRFTRSLAHAYFGDKFGHPPKNARMQFVNLGTPGDGFYNTKKYLFWTFIVGLGEPQIEKFSKFPLLIVIVVAVAVCGCGTAAFLYRRRTAGDEVVLFTKEPIYSGPLDEKALLEPDQMIRLNFDPRGTARRPESPNTSDDISTTNEPPPYGIVIPSI